jgi:hypothetical protein
MTTSINRALGALLLCAACGLAGCSQPFTDIVAINTEATGPWDVSDAKVSGNALTANVCMEHSGEADEISHRLLFQLRNKGYQKIDLTMYAPAGNGSAAQQQQVTWTPDQGKQLQPASQASQNPCAKRNDANAPTTERNAEPGQSGPAR